MKTAELRAIQTPLKDRYREDPEAGVITLEAEGELDSEDVACSVKTGKAIVEAGLHAASGGTGGLACSGDMLLEALVACAGVTMRSVAVNRGIELTSGTVRAEGDLDFRGTMGVDRDAPVGFRAIRLSFYLASPAGGEEIEKLVAQTERYCVVLQTIAKGVEVSLSYEVA